MRRGYQYSYSLALPSLVEKREGREISIVRHGLHGSVAPFPAPGSGVVLDAWQDTKNPTRARRVFSLNTLANYAKLKEGGAA
jgi:hypothetical protein